MARLTSEITGYSGPGSDIIPGISVLLTTSLQASTTRQTWSLAGTAVALVSLRISWPDHLSPPLSQSNLSATAMSMSTLPLLLTVLLLLPAGGQSGSVSYEVSRVVRPRLAGIVRKSHCGCSQRRAPVNYNRYSRPSADRLMAPPRRSARLGDWGYKVIRLQTRDICSVPQFRCSRPKAS